jgi:hypothetical protein
MWTRVAFDPSDSPFVVCIPKIKYEVGGVLQNKFVKSAKWDIVSVTYSGDKLLSLSAISSDSSKVRAEFAECDLVSCNYTPPVKEKEDEPLMHFVSTRWYEGDVIGMIHEKWKNVGKPKFTKGQKIRCKINMGVVESGRVEALTRDKIYTFSHYTQLCPDRLVIVEFPNSTFEAEDFEPVEYVSFSKAMELYEAGYGIRRIDDVGIYTRDKRDAIRLFSYEDILANDWYWVKKPEGKQ